jgi:WhiB family redox-sensing transcriptional regulator
MRNRTTKTTRAAAARQDESGRPACAGVHPEVFYSYEGEPTGARHDRERVAQAICRSCPIQAACLTSELQNGPYHQHGVRGGMTAEERRAEIRRRTTT